MAYGLKNISALDLRPSTGIGVSVPFSAASVFTTIYTTKDQLRYNMINYLLSDPRERPFNPTFGAGLRSKIFEQISEKTLSDIIDSLTNQVESTFSNVRVTDLNIDPDPDSNSIKINFSYSIINTGENDTTSLVIQM